MSYTDIRAVIEIGFEGGQKHTRVGINNELQVSVGYDSECDQAAADTSGFHLSSWDGDPKPFTREQKQVLADRMIELWQRYKTESN